MLYYTNSDYVQIMCHLQTYISIINNDLFSLRKNLRQFNFDNIGDAMLAYYVQF